MVFRFDELVDAVLGEFAAVARVLHAAEGDSWVGLRRLVDVAHPGLHLAGDALAALEVVGPDRGAEAELGVVGDFDGLLLVLDLEDRGDGAEQFLVRRRGDPSGTSVSTVGG